MFLWHADTAEPVGRLRTACKMLVSCDWKPDILPDWAYSSLKNILAWHIEYLDIYLSSTEFPLKFTLMPIAFFYNHCIYKKSTNFVLTDLELQLKEFYRSLNKLSIPDISE